MFKPKLDVPLSAAGMLLGAVLGVAAPSTPSQAAGWCYWKTGFCIVDCINSTCGGHDWGAPNCSGCNEDNAECNTDFGPCEIY